MRLGKTRPLALTASVLVALSGGLAQGCASSADDEDVARDDDEIISPVFPAVTFGTVNVTAPSPLSAPPSLVYTNAAGVRLELGLGPNRVPAGQGSIALAVPALGEGATQSLQITVNADETIARRLAVASFVVDPSKVQVDFGPSPVFRLEAPRGAGFAPEQFPTIAKSERIVLWEGQYGIRADRSFDGFPSQRPDLVGDTEVVLTPASDVRKFVRVRAAARPTFPDAVYADPAGVDARCKSWTGLVNGTDHPAGPYFVRELRFTTAPTTLGVLAGDSSNVLVANGTRRALRELPTPDDVKVNLLQRIEVDDVVVTTAAGTRKVRGRYRIERLDLSDWRRVNLGPPRTSACAALAERDFPFATRTGVDVVPGRYRVIVTATTEDGTQVQEYPISLPAE